MSLFDPYLLNFDGSPNTKRAKADIITSKGTKVTADQFHKIKQAYQEFCRTNSLSIAPSSIKTFSLDGNLSVRISNNMGFHSIYADKIVTTDKKTGAPIVLPDMWMFKTDGQHNNVNLSVEGSFGYAGDESSYIRGVKPPGTFTIRLEIPPFTGFYASPWLIHLYFSISYPIPDQSNPSFPIKTINPQHTTDTIGNGETVFYFAISGYSVLQASLGAIDKYVEVTVQYSPTELTVTNTGPTEWDTVWERSATGNTGFLYDSFYETPESITYKPIYTSPTDVR